MRAACWRYKRWKARRSPLAAARTSSRSLGSAAVAGGMSFPVAMHASVILQAWMQLRRVRFKAGSGRDQRGDHVLDVGVELFVSEARQAEREVELQKADI